MKSNPRPLELSRTGPAARQAGVATLLIIVLTGLALATLVFGAMGGIGALQARSLTLHAATQAQLQAWNGVEGVRQYLGQIGSTAALALANGTTLTFANSAMSATVNGTPSAGTGACPNTGTQVPMTVTNNSSAAGPARASVDTVICIVPGTPSYPGLAGASGMIRGPLQVSGLSTMIPDAVGSDKLVVDGNISNGGSGGTMTGFTSLSSTGNIDLSGAAADINIVQANGNIKIQGKFDSLSAKGNITTQGGATTATTITSNGAVDIMNGPSTCCSTASYDVIQATGNVQFDQSVPVNTVLTQANILTTAGSGGNTTTILSQAQAQGNYTESSCCSTVASGKIGGVLTKVGGHSVSQAVNLTVQPGLTVAVPTVPTITVATNKIDAYYYQSSANYIFDVDGSYRPTVKVNNVNGLTTGTTYYLVSSGGNSDYLCTTTTWSAGTCPKKICNGYSAYNTCFTTPSSGNPNWAIAGAGTTPATTTLAPGVMWFKGNLTVNNGYFFNTFIASGNITTGGSINVVDPAWGGTSGICSNTTSPFTSLYPTNLCVSGSYVDSAIANVALLAGGYVGSTFSGGVITVGAANVIKGNLVAGDTINTLGNTTIYGTVNTQHQSGGSSSNSFAASTTFNQQNLKVYPGTNSNGGAGSSASATAMWTRYR